MLAGLYAWHIYANFSYLNYVTSATVPRLSWHTQTPYVCMYISPIHVDAVLKLFPIFKHTQAVSADDSKNILKI